MVLSLRADFCPINLDLGTGNTDVVRTVDTKDKYYVSSLRTLITDYFKDCTAIIKDCAETSLVKEYQMSNARLMLFIEYEAQLDSNNAYLYGSWEATKDTDPKRNSQKCKDWLRRRPAKTVDYWKVLDH